MIPSLSHSHTHTDCALVNTPNLGLDEAMLEIDDSVHHTVTNGLGNDEPCIVRAVELQTLGDIDEGDAGVAETDPADPRLDHLCACVIE